MLGPADYSPGAFVVVKVYIISLYIEKMAGQILSNVSGPVDS